MMRRAVFAAEHAAGTVTRAITGGVAKCGLFGFQNQIERYAKATAELAIAAGAFAKFMLPEMQAESALLRPRCCRI